MGKTLRFLVCDIVLKEFDWHFSILAIFSCHIVNLFVVIIFFPFLVHCFFMVAMIPKF